MNNSWPKYTNYFASLFMLICLQVPSGLQFSCFAMSDEDNREFAELIKIKDLNLQLKRLDKYLLTHPQSARLIGYRAELDNAFCRHDDTIRDATKYFQLNKEPVAAQIYKVRAQAYMRKGELAKAITDLYLAKKLAADDGEIALMLGLAFERQAKYKEALEEYSRAIKLKFVRAYGSRSSLLFKMGRPTEATLDCIKHIQISKDSGSADSLCNSLYNEKKYRETIILTDGLINAKLAKPSVFELRARSFFYLKQYAEALSACETATKKCGINLDSLKFEIYAAQNHSEKALEQITKLIKANPKDLSLLLRRAEFYAEDRHYDLAIADYNKARVLVKSDVNAQARLAECHFRRGNYAEAIRYYEQVNKTTSYAKNSDSLTFEALSYKALNNYQDAVRVLNKAIEVKPLSSTLFAYRAECFGRLHDFKKADHDLSDAIVLSPKMYSLYCARAAIRLEAGDSSAAVSDYTSALADPGMRSLAYQGRAKAYRKLGQIKQAEKDEQAANAAVKSLEKDLFKQ